MTRIEARHQSAHVGSVGGLAQMERIDISTPHDSTFDVPRQEAAPTLNDVLRLARRGWYIFPVEPGGKKPLCKWRDASAQAEGIARLEFTRHAHGGEFPNIGLDCGKSGLVVIDLDRHADGPDGLAAWELLKTEHGIDDSGALVAETPSGGRHLIFADPTGGKIRNSAGKLAPGVDVRASGGYIVAPPSRNGRGGGWRWLRGDGKPGELPQEVVGLLWAKPEPSHAPERPQEAASEQTAPKGDKRASSYALAALESEIGTLAGTSPGTRNDQTNRAAFSLGQLIGAGLLDRAEVERELYGAAVQCGLVGDDGERSVMATIASGLDAGIAEPRKLPAEPVTAAIASPGPVAGAEADTGEVLLTDMGNSTRFARAHSDQVKYTQNLGWLVWAGTHWKQDETGAPMRLARQTATSIFDEAARHSEKAKTCIEQMKLVPADDQAALDKLTAKKAKSEALAGKAVKWAMKSQSRARLSAMLDLGESERAIVRLTNQFDRSGWLFNCTNGTLDLRTGELNEHDPAQLLTHCSPVAYDPGATCPTWERFLLEIFGDDEALVDYVQKAVGYSLAGGTREQCLFFMHGVGANGKSTFAQAIFGDVMGDYHKKSAVDTILQRQNTYIPNDVARLRGARVVVVSEVPEGRRLNESLVKDLTGGDPITARFLHQEFFEFTPTFKLWMYGNHKPVIRGTDLGIWRRIRLIPFDVTFAEADQDKTLPDKLKAERAGILAWAVRGCQQWQADGLTSPQAVREATSEYREGMDVIGQFLGECTHQNSICKVRFSLLYNAYDKWCDESGERAMSKRKFSERLVERGLEKYHGSGNAVYISGVGLVASEGTTQKS